MLVLPLLLLLPAPLLALAQTTTYLEAPPNNIAAAIGLIIAAAIPLLAKAFRDWQKDNADRRLSLILAGARMAYWLTEEAKRLFPDKLKDLGGTISFAEAKFIEALSAQGVTPTEDEKALVRLHWGAQHGAEKVREELAETAGVAAALPPR